MDQEDIEHIYRLSKDKIEETDMSLKRYSYDSIDWKDRLVGLRGARGVGKTTLLLQKIADSGADSLALRFARQRMARRQGNLPSRGVFRAAWRRAAGVGRSPLRQGLAAHHQEPER